MGKKAVVKKSTLSRGKGYKNTGIDKQFLHDEADEVIEAQDKILLQKAGMASDSEEEDQYAKDLDIKNYSYAEYDENDDEDDEEVDEGEIVADDAGDDTKQQSDSDADDYVEPKKGDNKKKKMNTRPITKDWGNQKDAFYNANIKLSKTKSLTEEERLAALEEEEEAKRIQEARMSRIKLQDFMDDVGEESLGNLLNKPKDKKASEKRVARSKSDNTALENLKEELKDVSLLTTDNNNDVSASNLSKEEKLKIILKDSPELIELLDDFKAKIKDVREQVQPLIEKVKASELPTNKGISFLEVKFHLLLNYCINIAFYLMLKAQGRPVKDHPVIKQLVQLRTILEKIKPLDKKLQYQINKLVKMATTKNTAAVVNDPLRFKPNPENMSKKIGAAAGGDEEASEDDEGADKDGNVYVPPKMVAVSYDVQEKQEKKARKELERAERVARSSRLLKDLTDEISGAPEEQYSIGAEHGKAHKSGENFAKELEEFEEDNFMRLRLSNKQKQMLDQSKPKLVDELELLTDFGDFVALDRATKVAGKAAKQAAEMAAASKPLSDYVNQVEMRSKASGKKSNADAIVPVTTRGRAVPVDQLSKNYFDAQEAAEENNNNKKKKKKDKKRAAGEDGEDKEMRKQKRLKEDQKLEKAMEQGNDEKRYATNMILNNRGLVPHKKKEDRNSRIKLKHKYEKALSKRKSMVKDHEVLDGAYGGERNIKKNVVRSTSLATK